MFQGDYNFSLRILQLSRVFRFFTAVILIPFAFVLDLNLILVENLTSFRHPVNHKLSFCIVCIEYAVAIYTFYKFLGGSKNNTAGNPAYLPLFPQNAVQTVNISIDTNCLLSLTSACIRCLLMAACCLLAAMANIMWHASVNCWVILALVNIVFILRMIIS